jgi:hypothetical protein
MLVKSYDLTGGALDYAFVKAYLKDHTWLNDPNFASKFADCTKDEYWAYASLEILKEFKISLMHVEEDDPYPIDDGPWSANIPGQEYGYTGPTPEIAIGRCVVAYKLGEDIEIPDELLKDK